MQDKELYEHIQGLTSAWTVSEIKLDIPAKEIHVAVSTPLAQSSAVLSGRKTLLATIRQRRSMAASGLVSIQSTPHTQ